MRFDIFTRALQTMGLTNYVFEAVPKTEADLVNVTKLVANEDGSVSQITNIASFEFTWQEIANVIESLPKFGIIELREKRDALLAKTDWTQTLDSPLTPETRQAFVTYRQALRNITNQYDSLDYAIFPDEPEIS